MSERVLRRLARHLTWNASQRRALAVGLVGLSAGLGVWLLFHSRTIADPLPASGARAAELADRIDPNTADWSTLAVLPAIGEKRAKEIVAFRERVEAREPGQVAFRTPADLLKVNGIGAKLVLQMTPYLRFPEDRRAPRR